ncbi:MAG TPA: glycosyltransferase family 25 protein [Agitococcus sp.]|nr:glycosyltransferase family 25 protein [Agitococcus sp.]
MKGNIFVVSLPNAYARREYLKVAFPMSYDYFTIIDAVNGGELSAKEFFSRIADYYNNFYRLMTPGEIGCALSHIKCYGMMVDTGLERALVLEDDVIGDDGSIMDALNIISKIDSNDVVIMGSQFVDSKYISLNGKFLFSSDEGTKVYLLNHNEPIWGTFSYGIGAIAANSISAFQEKTLRRADDWLIFSRSVGVRILYADVFSHPVDVVSDLERERRTQVISPRLIVVLKKLIAEKMKFYQIRLRRFFSA